MFYVDFIDTYLYTSHWHCIFGAAATGVTVFSDRRVLRLALIHTHLRNLVPLNSDGINAIYFVESSPKPTSTSTPQVPHKYPFIHTKWETEWNIYTICMLRILMVTIMGWSLLPHHHINLIFALPRNCLMDNSETARKLLTIKSTTFQTDIVFRPVRKVIPTLDTKAKLNLLNLGIK